MRPIEGLLGYDLHWSTVEEEKGKAKCVKGKSCALCHKSYSGGPFLIEGHLDATVKPRQVSACVPATEPAQQQLASILIEIRSRRAAAAAKADHEVS